MEFKTETCPICSGKTLQIIAVTKDEQTRYFGRCTKCGHEGPFSPRSDLEAKGAWNGGVDALEYQNAKSATRKTILDAATTCVCKERNDQYGEPEDCFQDIANLWAAYKGVDFDPFDVAMMMSLLKVARAKANPQHTDNYIDLCGYGSIAGELANKEENE